MRLAGHRLMGVASLAVLFVALGCADAPTELVVIVSTDLDPGSDLDAYRVEVERDGGPVQVSTARVESAPSERRLSIWHTGGPLGPLRLRVAALRESEVVVETRREVGLRRGRRTTLRVHLAAACVGAPACPPDETCERGGCRSVQVIECELDEPPCAGPDGGPRDAGRRDAGPLDGGIDDGHVAPDDGGEDTGPPCPLAGGICGFVGTHLPGDRVALRACDDPLSPVDWEVELPSSLITRAGTLVLDQVGTYTIDASVPSIVGCTARETFAVDPPVRALPVGRPATAVRGAAARPGTLFLATSAGAWAVRPTIGWRDLSVGAVGTLPTADLGAIAVRGLDPLLVGRGDRDSLARAVVSEDLASVRFETVALPAGDRSCGGAETLRGGAESGGPGPVALATRDGVVLVEGAPEALSARAIGLREDGTDAIAVAIDAGERAGAGAVWRLRGSDLINASISAVPPFNGGMRAATGLSPVAISVHDGDPARLVLCGAAGVWIYDLSGDWSMRTTLPPPLATLPIACRGVEHGPDGDLWIASATGLLRTDRDGAMLWQGAGAGLDGASLSHVTVTWDAGRREVWVVGAALDVWALSADAVP